MSTVITSGGNFPWLDDSQSKGEPITFGSTVSFELFKQKGSFLHSEGFILSRLECKAFSTEESDAVKNDFNYCNFKIVPFSTSSNFKTQISLIQKLITELDEFFKKDLENRRKDITELKQNLENEFITNQTLMDKLRGSPVLFETSIFQLVHAVSYKFLSLNTEDEKNLYFELVDDPSDNSFFKFSPRLELQKQRSNMVFSDDLVAIYSTRLICNRNPSIYCPWIEEKKYLTLQEMERKLTDDNFEIEKDSEKTVIANVGNNEVTTEWNLKLFSSDDIIPYSKNYLLEHDALYLILSEKQLSLAGVKNSDRYEQLFDKISLGVAMKSNNLEIENNEVRHKSISVDSGFKKLDISHSFEEDGNDQTYKENKDIALEFYDLKNQKSAFQLQSSCLWKIEGQNMQKGGIVQWENMFRLRHFTSGKYLRVCEKPNVDERDKKYTLELSNNVDVYTFFNLVPFENLLTTEDSRKYVGKDAFLKLQNYVTSLFVSFDENFDSSSLRKNQSSSQVILTDREKDNYTFKIRRADYNEIWEISFLLNVHPEFNKAVDCLKGPLQGREITKSALFVNLTEIYAPTMDTIDNLIKFVKNRIYSNISIFEEFGKISSIRQTILREQSILGLICWLLYKVFPTDDELQKVKFDRIPLDYTKESSKTLGAEKYMMKQNNLNDIKLIRLREENVVRKKMKIASYLYEFLRVCCLNNDENQNYFLKFLSFYTNHIGHGAFVTTAFEACIGSNEKILKNLGNFNANVMEVVEDADSKKAKSLIPNILYKFKKFPRYEKSDILNLLAKFCSVDEENSIYKNQESIFHTIVNDEDLKSRVFMKIYSSNEMNQQIYIELLGEKTHQKIDNESSFPIEEFLQSEGKSISKKEKDYLKQQLMLFSSLCLGRNYACVEYFGKMLPLKLLIKYTLSNNLPEDFRACFCQLIQNIYIDKEPRTILMKPNLVRKLELKKKDYRGKDSFRNPFGIFNKKSPAKKASGADYESPKSPIKDENKELLFAEISPAFNADKIVSPTIGANESELSSLEELKNDLINYLEDKHKSLEDLENSSASVYNVLTLEVIKVILMMLKFGLFNKSGNKDTVKEGSASPNKSPFKFKNFNIFGANAQIERSEIDKVVRYLAALLEFDGAYFHALKTNSIKRKCEVKEDLNLLNMKFNTKMMENGFNDIKNLGKNFQDIFSGKKEKESKGKVKFAIAEKETRNQDPLFERINCLKRILASFSNKTYTNKQDDEVKNYEVSIKIKICEVFNYLLDMREDYQIDNLMEYFRETFIEKFKDCKEEFVTDEMNFDELQQLLPECASEVGEKIIKTNAKFKNFTKGEEFKFFDDILDRPFMEILMLGFYFSEDSKLQNSIMSLIYRSTTQKLTLFNMINKLEILFSKVQIEVYESFNHLVQKLNLLVSNSQTWIHISESDKDDFFLGRMEKTIQKLGKIESLFKSSLKDLEFLATKQSIFKNTGGIKIIVSLIEIIELNIDPHVALIFEENYTNFHDRSIIRPSESRFTKLPGQKINSTLVHSMFKITQLCYSILGFSCYRNSKFQEYLFKHLHHPFKSNFHLKFNVSQIEFFDKLLDTNVDLKNKVTIEDLQYFIELIILHGKYTEFIDFFRIFALTDTHTEPALNLENNKKILTVLFDDENIKYIHPFTMPISKAKDKAPVVQRKFFSHPENIKEYQGTFIKVVAKALKLDVGMSYISKCSKNLPISDLLKFLLEKTHETKGDPFETVESLNLQIKIALIDLLILFVSKSTQALQDLYNGTPILNEIVKIIRDQTINVETFSDDSIRYVNEKFLPLFNLYCEKFLSDLGNLIGGPSGLQSREEELKVKEEFLSFAVNFLNNLEKFSKSKDIEEGSPLSKNALKICKIFNISSPKLNLKIPNNEKFNLDEKSSLMSRPSTQKFDFNYEASEEEEEREEKYMKQETETVGVSKKKSTNLFSMMKNKIRGIGKLMVINQPESRDKYLSLPKLDEENTYSAQSLSQLWSIFKYLFTKSEKIRTSIKEEKNVFTNSIMKISSVFDQEGMEEKMKDIDKMEILLNSDDIILKFLNYLEFWKSKHADKSYIVYLLQIFDRVIKQKEELSDEQEETQNMFDRLNTTKILLILIWEDTDNDHQFLYYLFKFFVSLLFGGNRQVQKTIYNFFQSNPISEKFFRKMNELITNEINFYHNRRFNSDSQITDKRKHLLPKILRLLQLFCEGHNFDLQNYLRFQKQSKTNYDMITTTVQLLISFKISNMNYDTISQCFDTLTEYIQGPCKENQKAIVDSKFLEYAVNVLSEEEKIFELADIREQRSESISRYDNKAMGERKQSRMADISFDESPSPRIIRQATISRMNNNIARLNVHPGRLARIKMKCIVTIVSLLECNEKSDNIAIRIRRALPFGVLKNNLIRVYELYKKRFIDEYSMNCFGLGDIKIDQKQDPESYELIIENGFNIYILLNLLMDGHDHENEEDEEVNEFLAMFQEEEKTAASLFKNSIIGEFGKLGTSVLGLGFGFMKDLKKNVIDKTFKLNQETDELKQIQESLEKKQIQQNALAFFKQNIAHIEIVRDNNLYRVFFPLLPITRFLPKSRKTEFHENVNRESTKTKISNLMKDKDDFIRTMNHEEKLNKLFNTNKLIGIIFNHEKLWKDLAFITNLTINAIIIASYSEYFPSKTAFIINPDTAVNYARKNEPRFFLQEQLGDTLIAIRLIGIFNIVFSGLVVLFFLMKRAPLILEEKNVWAGFFEMKINKFKKLIIAILKCFYCLYLFASDFDFMYYSAYISFSIAGLAVHPFLFCFHLIDFLRIDLLKNVVLSIWIPRKQLILTFMILILEEYYFSIISYVFFYSQETATFKVDTTSQLPIPVFYCESFWKCWVEVFDQTFKQSGAIGAILNDCYHYFPDSSFCNTAPQSNPVLGNYSQASLLTMRSVLHDNKQLFFARFFYDNLFYIFVVIVTISMVAGVIIDTFANLTDELQTKKKDKEHLCFICGINSEKLDKVSERGGFHSHIKNDHYMWNYIFYIAYLKWKEKTEYNGNESYVWTTIEKKELSWFPINRAIAIKEIEEEGGKGIELMEEILENIKVLEKEYVFVQDKMKKVIAMRDRRMKTQSQSDLKRSHLSFGSNI